MRTGLLLLLFAVAPVRALTPDGRPGLPVRVIVVVVYAGTGPGAVDPKLRTLAREVAKRDDRLTSFRMAACQQKSIPAGQSHTFALPDEQSLKVTVEGPCQNDGKICLSIVPPGGGEVTYSCTCNKFVPIVTGYVNKADERMILAVMSKPCPGHGK